MKKLNIVVVSLVFAFCIFINSSDIKAATVNTKQPQAKPVQTQTVKPQTTQAKTTTPTTATKPTYTYIPVKSLDLVNNPTQYLNKRVKITAKFDKFSSLGLDYKPAMRSSEQYITFLIKRDDATNDIPLSELKNFLKRDLAEKFIDLDTDDVIEYSGLVFSNALGDAWLDVENLKIITKKSKKTESTKTK